MNQPSQPNNGNRTNSGKRITEKLTDTSVRAATGRGWDEWFAVLDEWGAVSRTHPEIARHVREVHGVSGWHAQSVTVAYEQERGLRQVGQNSDGEWQASASRTIEASAAAVIEAFADPEQRRRWLPDDGFRLRTHRPAKSVTADFEDALGGVGRLDVRLTAVNGTKTRLGIGHTKLPDAGAVDMYKEFWRERLGVLKEQLEGGSGS